MSTGNLSEEEIKKINEQQQSNAENSKENEGVDSERVVENLITQITEKTEVTLEKANARIESAINMGASPEDVSIGNILLSPVQQKMKELEAEYVRKLAEVSQKHQSRIEGAATLGALDKIKTKKQADIEKIQAEELLTKIKEEDEQKLALERQKEEKQENEEREAQELEAQKGELANLDGYKAELAPLQSQKSEIEELLATKDDADVEEARGELENELSKINEKINDLSEKVKKLEEVNRIVISKEKEIEISLKEKQKREKELMIMVENIESGFNRDLSNKNVERNFDNLESTRNTLYSLDLKKPDNLSRDEYIDIVTNYLFNKVYKKQQYDKIKKYEESKDKILEDIKASVEVHLFRKENKHALEAVIFFEERDELIARYKNELNIIRTVANEELVGGQYKSESYKEYKTIKDQEAVKEKGISDLKEDIKKIEGTILKIGLNAKKTLLETNKTEIEELRKELNKKSNEMELNSNQREALYKIFDRYFSETSENPINHINFSELKNSFKRRYPNEINDSSPVVKVQSIIDFFEGSPTEEQIKIYNESVQLDVKSREINGKFDRYF